MNILLHLPQNTLNRCFAPSDLQRLQARHSLIALPAQSNDSLPQAWMDHARDFDAIIAGWGTPPITDAMLDAAPQLRLIAYSAGSVRHLLPPSFWSRGIRLTTANEPLGIGVAETTLSLIIAGLKGFFPAAAHTRAGRWGTEGLPIREFYQTTVGIIGASKIGRHLIRLLKNFEVQILVTDPYLSDHEAAELAVQRVGLDDLLRQSDVVSLHAPSLPETRRMLAQPQFALMKDGAIFINTARGALVDEQALIVELKTGRISAFIDVTDPEPPAIDHPFRQLPNCILLPHIAGAISNGCLRQGRWIVDDLLAFADRLPLRGEVTAARASIMA